MALGTLTIDIEARLAKLEQGMDRATRLIEQRNARVEKAFTAASAAATKLVGAVGALGLAAFARSVIDGVDALNDFADATGTTVENASALEDVALRTGTAVEAVSAGMVKFNDALANAKPGSEQARVFEKLGLDAAKLRQLDPAEALLQTAKALATFADDGNKARLVQELFGRSVREIAPFLKDLAEAGQLNATVTAEQTRAAEEFNRAIFSLRKDIVDLARSVLEDALPAVARFVRELKAGREAFGGFGSAFVNLAGEKVQPALTSLQEYQSKLAAVREEIRRAGAGEFQLDFGGMGRNRMADLRETEERLKRFVDYYEKILGITNVQGGRGSIVPGGGRPSVGDLPQVVKTGSGKAGRAEFVGPDVPPALAAALKSIEDADEAKLARLREQLQALVNLAQSGMNVPAGAFTDTIEQIDRLDPAIRAAVAANEALQASMEDGQRVFDATRTPAEALAAEIERLNKLLAGGAIDWDTYARATFQAQDRFDEATAKAKAGADDLNKTARDLGLTFSSAFEDAIVNGEKFSDVLRSIDRDITRILIRKLVTEPLAEGVTGFVAGATGGTGSGKGFDWGALFAKWFQSAFAGGFASGGYIPPGRWGMTGERGPEVVYGGRTGATVRPTGSSVVVNVQTAPGATRMAAQQQAELVGREVMRALNRNG